VALTFRVLNLWSVRLIVGFPSPFRMTGRYHARAVRINNGVITLQRSGRWRVAFESEASPYDPDPAKHEKARGVGRCEGRLCRLGWGKSVGRICKEAYGDSRRCWSINASPYPAPPPHNGVTKTLDAAEHEFKVRYEEMKQVGVRPFGRHLRRHRRIAISLVAGSLLPPA
jgi:hypothetical protein